MTPADSGTNRRARNPRGGSFSRSSLLRGIAQHRNGGYIIYAQPNAMIAPSTPPNPSSRSGFACTINKLPNPRDAQTIDQNEAGKVMRSAPAARLEEPFFRSASACQLKVI